MSFFARLAHWLCREPGAIEYEEECAPERGRPASSDAAETAALRPTAAETAAPQPPTIAQVDQAIEYLQMVPSEIIDPFECIASVLGCTTTEVINAMLAHRVARVARKRAARSTRSRR